MVFKCIVPNCRGNYATGPKVSTFGFPKQIDLQNKWLAAIPRDFTHYTVTKCSRVCEVHFKKSDIKRCHEYICEKTGKKEVRYLEQPRLNKEAVPCIFPNCPEYLSSNTFTRDDPETKKRRRELSQLESVLAENLQVQEEENLKFKVDTLDELKEKIQVSAEELGAKYQKKLPESKADKTSLKLKLPIARSVATYMPSSTQSVQPATLTNTAITSDLQSASTSGVQPFTFSTPAIQLAPIILSVAPSELECVHPDSVLPDVKPPPELLASANNVTSSNWSDSTCFESQVVIKQEIIETEEDVPDSPFYLSSACCSRDSFAKVQESERFSPLVQNPVSSEGSISLSSQKEAKRPRLSSFVACSLKDDTTENPDVSKANQRKDHFDEFGVFVASKLRNLDWKSCSSVQKAIVDLLFEAESGIFLTPQERTILEEKSDSIIDRLHEAIAEKSTFLQSPASCSRDSTGHRDSDRLSPLVKKLVTSDESKPRFQNFKSYQKRTKRSRPNSPVACSSKDGLPEHSNVLEANQPKDQFFAFGVFVASKMRNLDWISCAFVQNAITDLLFEVESGHFVTLQEKSNYEEKSDSIIKRPHDVAADTSTAELSS